MRKVLAFTFLLILFGGLTVGCTRFSSGEELPSVEKAWVAPISLETGWDTNPGTPFYVAGISPDGKVIYSRDGYQANLETGEIQSVYPVSFDDFVMSPNGHYISGISNSLVRPLYDTVKKDFTSDKSSYGPITDFSPDSTRASFLQAKVWTIPEGNPVSNWPLEVDFRQSKHTGGSANFLWDTDLNVPTAKVNPCGTDCNNPTLGGDILLSSLAKDLKVAFGQYSKKIYHIPSPNKLAGSAFSPDGQYVLLVIWERTAVPQEDRGLSPDFVTDSVLALVNWRTGTGKEIFRLSTIDTEHIVAWDRILWSANGEIIIVPRYEAEPLVIKLDYP
jgi:hypothetical protein